MRIVDSSLLSVLPGLCLFTPIILILDPSEVTPSAPIRPGTNSNIPIFGFTKWKQKLTVECWETIPIMKRKGQIVNFSQKQNFAFHFSVGPRIIVTNWVCHVTRYHYSWWPVSLCDHLRVLCPVTCEVFVWRGSCVAQSDGSVLRTNYTGTSASTTFILVHYGSNLWVFISVFLIWF